METLSKDVVGLIFDEMTPLDWICTSIVCKSWWFVIQKWMRTRKISFIKHLKQETNLFGIRLSDEKKSLCLRPFYYLQDIGKGCKGEIKDFLCAGHRSISLYNRELCENCLDKPSSIKCFGKFCNSLKCRDYIYVLRNGTAVPVRAYPCAYKSCDKKTDAKDGYCFSHAVKIMFDEDEKDDKTEIPKYKCLGLTKANTHCRNKPSSRLSKCHQHISSPLSLL